MELPGYSRVKRTEAKARLLETMPERVAGVQEVPKLMSALSEQEAVVHCEQHLHYLDAAEVQEARQRCVDALEAVAVELYQVEMEEEEQLDWETARLCYFAPESQVALLVELQMQVLQWETRSGPEEPEMDAQEEAVPIPVKAAPYGQVVAAQAVTVD